MCKSLDTHHKQSMHRSWTTHTHHLRHTEFYINDTSHHMFIIVQAKQSIVERALHKSLEVTMRHEHSCTITWITPTCNRMRQLISKSALLIWENCLPLLNYAIIVNIAKLRVIKVERTTLAISIAITVKNDGNRTAKEDSGYFGTNTTQGRISVPKKHAPNTLIEERRRSQGIGWIETIVNHSW